MGHYSGLATYIGASILFVAILTYAFVYSARLKTKRATEQKLGRRPVDREEGIAVATQQKEQSGRSGTLL